MARVTTETFDARFGDDPFVDVLGDTAVKSPPAKLAQVAIGAMGVLALVGFWTGLNNGDHRTRLPGDAHRGGEFSGVDFSGAKLAVALKPEETAPPPPPRARRVEAAAVLEAEVAPLVEAPPPAEAAPTAPSVTPAAPPPPSLDGLF